MKLLRSWMSHHPFKVVLFTFLFTLIPAIMAVTNEALFYPGLVAFAVFVAVWAVSVWRYSKHVITILLLAALFSYGSEPTPPPQKNAAAIGVGVVIICVGSYCVYRVVKFCERKFPPKDTNAPPQEFSAVGGEYGGACQYSAIGSCYVPPTLNSFPYEDMSVNPTTFTLNVGVHYGVVTTSMSVNNQEGTTQTWDEFQADMATHGLFLTGRPSAQAQYEMDGAPCDPLMVPIELNPLTGRVSQKSTAQLQNVSVERSPNLTDWYPLLSTDVADGTMFQVIDTTREGQMFYRVQLTQP
jgi:hypothetical protein